MTTLHADQALLPSGWAGGVRITLSGSRIADVETGVEPRPGDERHGVLLPAMGNLHSHAFQRGMAGLAELRGPGEDSFWSWRTVMYRFALTMDPGQMQAIAAQLYVEMLEAGFCRVGEFHYLHHDTDGRPYGNPAEMAERLVAAAAETGLGLTLLPVFYAHSGFGGAPPHDGQRRFITDLDGFARLLEASRMAAGALSGTVTGIAPHSLRAVTPAQLAALQDLAGDGPIHIHVAEQVKEVEDCLAWCGQRPVSLLLDQVALSARWCLIHATHMTEAETVAMARSGAIAGLCPITEANLGDGPFAAEPFLAAGGHFGIGSDSNILISLGGELRQLEYSQRLALLRRNVIAPPGGSTGRRLFEAALQGGAAALGVDTGLAPGRPADLLSLTPGAAMPLGGDRWLDGLIFAESARIDCVWAAGTKQVEAGRHRAREAIAARFRSTMAALAGDL